MPKHLHGIFALLVVTLVWGTTFPAMKDLTGYFPPVWIVFIRFVMASLVLSYFFLRAARQDIQYGMVMAVLLFACYMFQMEGLKLTTSNRNAFITGLNVLIVPLIGILLGQKLELRIMIAIALAVTGLFALCWDGGAWAWGDTLALIGAFCFGAYVKLMEVFTRKSSNLMSFTAAQITGVALCAGVYLLLTEVPVSATRPEMHAYLLHIWQGVVANWINFAYLGLICTAAIISLQTWGQHRASANEAAVIYAFEPACAAIAAYFWLNEKMGPTAIVGALLMIVGMIVSQWNTNQEKKLLVPD